MASSLCTRLAQNEFATHGTPRNVRESFFLCLNRTALGLVVIDKGFVAPNSAVPEYCCSGMS